MQSDGRTFVQFVGDDEPGRGSAGDVVVDIDLCGAHASPVSEMRFELELHLVVVEAQAVGCERSASQGVRESGSEEGGNANK
jgi:hypothetical protein